MTPSSVPQPGTLYVVATPLGNLEDLSFRAVRVLGEVDLVLAEDTRRTRGLLAHLDLHKPLESLHGDSHPGRITHVLEALAEGHSVAYLSDAGTPGVSDPGAALVRAAREAGLPVVPVPGPSAPATAFSVSGFTTSGFLFVGYPPRSAGQRREFLLHWASLGLPVILFESPQRIPETLADLAALLPDREVVLARELTKQFEQIVACPAREAPAALTPEQLRGEFTLLIAAPEGGAASPDAATAPDETHLSEALHLLREAGVPRRTIAQVLQLLTPLSRNQAYDRAGG